MESSETPCSNILPFNRSEISTRSFAKAFAKEMDDGRSEEPTAGSDMLFDLSTVEQKIDDSIKCSQLPMLGNSRTGCAIFPTGIIHNKNPKDSPFSAIAVISQLCPPSLMNSDDICIFSQERLCDCDALGAIVYSKTWKGSLEWHYLCNSSVKISEVNPKGVHIFDINYLKEWVKQKGPQYITCPLCKEGAATDRKMDEHEIDSLDQLVERRSQAKRRMDLPLQYFVEQLMLAKIGETKWEEDPGRARKQEDHLREIMLFWVSRRQIPNFFTKIVDALKKSVMLDIPTNARIMLERIKDHHQVKEVCGELVQIGAKHNSFDCIKLICEEFSDLVMFSMRPLALLYAIKEMNVSIIEFLIHAMVRSKQHFVCDDVFRETIMKDMVDVAKEIIIHRWHKPSEADFNLSKRLDGKMWRYLSSRRIATQNISILDPNNDENVLTLDDDEWGSDNDDDFSEQGEEEW